MTQDTTTGIAIPDEIMAAAYNVCMDLDIFKNPINADPIARAIMAERERCAKIADDFEENAPGYFGMSDDPAQSGAFWASERIAAAIRTPTKGADHE